ncbi:MAG: prolyl oligopeptidase family serine peptidase [Candidatus Limnocylindria bacterium]
MGSDGDALLVRAVESLAGMGFCSTPSFSPDGSRIAFISDLSGSPQVWTVATTGGWPRRVTAFPDQVTHALWSPVGDRIAVQVAPGGGLDQQVYTVRADGSDVRRLTPGGSENNRLARWSADGASLFIVSSRDDPSHFDLFAIDLPTGTWRPVARTRGVSDVTDLSRDGRLALLVRMVARGDSNVYLVDVEDAGEILLTPHEGQALFTSAKFGADGAVWLASDDGRERSALARIALRDGRPDALEYVAAREDADLDRFELTDAGTLGVLVWNVAGTSEIEIFDVATRRRTHGPVLAQDICVEATWSRDGERIAVVMTGAAAPVDIWTGDPRAHLTQLTHSPHPGVDLSALVRPRLERFTAHDGLELTGWSYVPRRFDAPGPCVLSFHGGPEAQERPLLNRTYQCLLANGIAVFAPNVRGSAGFGKTFVHLDDRERRFDAVRDIESAARHVVSIGVADRGRLGITGGSYGGYMTMAGIADYPDLFQGAVCVCGIVNFLTFFAHTQPWMAAVSTSEYGDPETQRELLESLSPINRLDRVKTPLLVLHGANDTNVPLVEAEQMVRELRDRRVEVESVIFHDEGHGFTKTANRTRAAVETVRWFARHL